MRLQQLIASLVLECYELQVVVHTIRDQDDDELAEPMQQLQQGGQPMIATHFSSNECDKVFNQ